MALDTDTAYGNEGKNGSRLVSRRGYLASVSGTGLAVTAGCIGGPSGGSGGTTTINIITWEEFTQLKEDIENKLDVSLSITTSTSSSEMFSGWNSGQDEQFDIAVPNNNFVPKMMDADLVAPVDKDSVSNWDGLYDKFHEFADNQFTANGDHHGVPIRFGWYGYGYDTREVPEHDASYKILFEDDYVDVDLEGNIIMYDDYFKTLGATALYLGYQDAFEGSRVTLSEDQIEEVKQTLIDQKPRLQGYIASDPTYIKSFRQGDFLVGHSGRNEIVEMWANDDDWPGYAAPKEGSLAWFESAVVSKKSENKEMAWKVINEFISAENGAALAEAGFSPSCNPATQDNLSDAQNDLFGAIDPSRLDAFVPFKAIDDKEPQWQAAWEDIGSA
jgi:spermidine/putrescine transport system substrate-binding protein